MSIAIAHQLAIPGSQVDLGLLCVGSCCNHAFLLLLQLQILLKHCVVGIEDIDPLTIHLHSGKQLGQKKILVDVVLYTVSLALFRHIGCKKGFVLGIKGITERQLLGSGHDYIAEGAHGAVKIAELKAVLVHRGLSRSLRGVRRAHAGG